VRDALRKFGLKPRRWAACSGASWRTHVDAGLVLCGTVNEATNQVEAALL
jgi:hypothetical protein